VVSGSGVPQGSVMGPILFILFVNDISDLCVGEVTVKLFADDLKLYNSIKLNNKDTSLQDTLVNLEAWCSKWQLNINVAKCHVMHCGKNNTNIQYIIDGNVIGISNLVSDLGVDMEPALKYDNRINRIIGKAYARVGLLFRGFASKDPVLFI
jgi:ribonuclease P/MRP protein subunit RPP40